MNYISTEIINIYETRFRGDKPYIASKRKNIGKLNKFDAFALCAISSLDGEGLKMLANNLNVSEKELAFVSRFCSQKL
ncbi:MAG: hypothetical protein QM500_14500 [Methylococcales bacterium]